VHATREAWLGAAWRHGDEKAQRVAQMCCWNNVVVDLQRLPDEQRLAMLTDFFSVYPTGGAEIAAVLNKLGTTPLFVPNQPLAKVVVPISTWAEKLGVELGGVDQVAWGPQRTLGQGWQDIHLKLRRTLSAEEAGDTYLLRLDDILVAVVAVQRDRQDRVGRLALQDIKLIAQRALWDLVLEQDSGWGHLLEVVFMGFWPVGLTADNRFVITSKLA
jgi:hypothetical protein